MEFTRRTLLSGLSLAAAPAAAAAVSSQIKDLQAAIDAAHEGVLSLPAGEFSAEGARAARPILIEGVPGLTRLTNASLTIADCADVTLRGLTFSGGSAQAMVLARGVERLRIEDCSFVSSKGIGLSLEKCSGTVRGTSFSNLAISAVFALDSRGLEISGNTLSDIGTNGIQVWTSEKTEDGTIVANNHIARIGAVPGDTGETGNGISIFRAGNAIVSGNRISDCVFSGIRNNSGSNCQIINNSISRAGEVALYCEFAFQGAVVSGNLIENAGHGISITNFDVGGRLATVSNNVVRQAKAGGISAEAQTLVIGNVVEDAIDYGISLGWAWGAKELTAANNIVIGCGRGITFSVADGAEPPMIVNNRITGSRLQAIVAMNYDNAASGDLSAAGTEMPQGAVISGNMVS